MPKFRKKPVVVEAFQMTADRFTDNKDWPEWLNYAWQKLPSATGCFYFTELAGVRTYWLATLEGSHEVSVNDFIIQGVKGELYPCKPDIFALTYEEA